MERRVQEETLRTVVVAAAGFAALYFAVPGWARDGVLVFGGIYAALVVAIDGNVRDWIPGHRRSRDARDDGRAARDARDDGRAARDARDHGEVSSTRAQSPGGRRAAT